MVSVVDADRMVKQFVSFLAWLDSLHPRSVYDPFLKRHGVKGIKIVIFYYVFLPLCLVSTKASICFPFSNLCKRPKKYRHKHRLNSAMKRAAKRHKSRHQKLKKAAASLRADPKKTVSQVAKEHEVHYKDRFKLHQAKKHAEWTGGFLRKAMKSACTKFSSHVKKPYAKSARARRGFERFHILACSLLGHYTNLKSSQWGPGQFIRLFGRFLRLHAHAVVPDKERKLKRILHCAAYVMWYAEPNLDYRVRNNDGTIRRFMTPEDAAALQHLVKYRALCPKWAKSNLELIGIHGPQAKYLERTVRPNHGLNQEARKIVINWQSDRSARNVNRL